MIDYKILAVSAKERFLYPIDYNFDMALQKELLSKGFKENGPYGLSELSKALEFIIREHPNLEEIRIVRGEKARDDMKDYPNLCMIYILDKIETIASYTSLDYDLIRIM